MIFAKPSWARSLYGRRRRRARTGTAHNDAARGYARRAPSHGEARGKYRVHGLQNRGCDPHWSDGNLRRALELAQRGETVEPVPPLQAEDRRDCEPGRRPTGSSRANEDERRVQPRWGSEREDNGAASGHHPWEVTQVERKWTWNSERWPAAASGGVGGSQTEEVAETGSAEEQDVRHVLACILAGQHAIDRVHGRAARLQLMQRVDRLLDGCQTLDIGTEVPLSLPRLRRVFAKEPRAPRRPATKNVALRLTHFHDC